MKIITVVASANPMGSNSSRIMRKAEAFGFVKLVRMDKQGRHYECPDDFECTRRHVNKLISKS